MSATARLLLPLLPASFRPAPAFPLMSTTVFTIANQKGGVGKTTTAVHLAAALAEKKIPTLLVDLDPQANATSAIGVEKQEGRSLYGPLRGEGAAAEMIVATSTERLSLIPSEEDLGALEIELAGKENYGPPPLRVATCARLGPVSRHRHRLPPPWACFR